MWSEEEISLIKRLFQKHLDSSQYLIPCQEECEQAIRDHPVLQGRSWIQLKMKVYNAQKKLMKGTDLDSALCSKMKVKTCEDDNTGAAGDVSSTKTPSTDPTSTQISSNDTDNRQESTSEESTLQEGSGVVLGRTRRQSKRQPDSTSVGNPVGGNSAGGNSAGGNTAGMEDVPGGSVEDSYDETHAGDHWQGTKWGKSQTSDQLHVCPSGREYFKWSSAQARAIQVCFKSYFCGKNRDKIPGKLDCVHAQKRFPVLAAIPWAKIKNKVYNNQIAAKKNPGKYKRVPDEEDELEEEEEEEEGTEDKHTDGVSVRPYSRTVWTSDELDAIRDGFDDYFTEHLDIHPGKQDCELVMSEYPVLQPRGWKLVKHCVINMQKKCKKYGSVKVV